MMYIRTDEVASLVKVICRQLGRPSHRVRGTGMLLLLLLLLRSFTLYKVTGGNHTDWETIQDFDCLGFPIAEVHNNDYHSGVTNNDTGVGERLNGDHKATGHWGQGHRGHSGRADAVSADMSSRGS